MTMARSLLTNDSIEVIFPDEDPPTLRMINRPLGRDQSEGLDALLWERAEMRELEACEKGAMADSCSQTWLHGGINRPPVKPDEKQFRQAWPCREASK